MQNGFTKMYVRHIQQDAYCLLFILNSQVPFFFFWKTFDADKYWDLNIFYVYHYNRIVDVSFFFMIEINIFFILTRCQRTNNHNEMGSLSMV